MGHSCLSMQTVHIHHIMCLCGFRCTFGPPCSCRCVFQNRCIGAHASPPLLQSLPCPTACKAVRPPPCSFRSTAGLPISRRPSRGAPHTQNSPLSPSARREKKCEKQVLSDESYRAARTPPSVPCPMCMHPFSGGPPPPDTVSPRPLPSGFILQGSFGPSPLP